MEGGAGLPSERSEERKEGEEGRKDNDCVTCWLALNNLSVLDVISEMSSAYLSCFLLLPFFSLLIHWRRLSSREQGRGTPPAEEGKSN